MDYWGKQAAVPSHKQTNLCLSVCLSDTVTTTSDPSGSTSSPLTSVGTLCAPDDDTEEQMDVQLFLQEL